jgi:hypothetical protein
LDGDGLGWPLTEAEPVDGSGVVDGEPDCVTGGEPFSAPAVLDGAADDAEPDG